MCNDKEKNKHKSSELENMQKACNEFGLRIENMLNSELWVNHFSKHLSDKLIEYDKKEEPFYLISMHDSEYHKNIGIPLAQIDNSKTEEYFKTGAILLRFKSDITEDCISNNDAIDIARKNNITALDYILETKNTQNPKETKSTPAVLITTKSTNIFLTDKIIFYEPKKYYHINKINIKVED